jgi:hypothetical protein
MLPEDREVPHNLDSRRLVQAPHALPGPRETVRLEVNFDAFATVPAGDVTK